MKKTWEKPQIKELKIKKITLGGSGTASEQGTPSTRPRPLV